MGETAPASPSLASTAQGRAGAARVDITPPIGAPLIGFAGRGPATGVLDPLAATVLFLQSGGPEGTALALVSCDLEGIDAEWTDEVQCRARAATGIADLHVIVSATHTHYAPAGPSMDNEGELEHPVSIAYTRLLVYDLVGAIQLACSRARPARLRVVAGESDVGVNRRETTPNGDVILGHNPAGPRDARVVLVVVEGVNGDAIASAVSFACHPVCLGSECRDVSADFIAPLRSTVEQVTGVPMLFLQGAAGDINPRTMGESTTTPLDTAMPLAAEVLRLWNTTSRTAPHDISIQVCAQTFAYPPLLPESRTDAVRAVSLLADRLTSLGADRSADPADVSWTQLRLSRARDALRVIDGEDTARPVEARQYAVRIGPQLAISTAPCELFTVLGQDIIRRSSFATTVFVGYANGLIGYVPDRASYEEGGYEVTHATLVARGAGEEIVENSVQLLYALASSTP
ncbi:hypothetical protein ACRAWC_08840 [Leifsonia sp. L25]|uniref:hypothetical protein n=1 Tax=Actinomycetes TaxID=1760 RepID=UPI003D698BAE